MLGRSVLLEMLVMESKGLLCKTSKEVIEMCCGWNEGSCNDEMEYIKYLDAYDKFLKIHEKYVLEHLHMFGVVSMFEDVGYYINDGNDYKSSVVKMIREKFKSINIPLAKPMVEMMSEEMKDVVSCGEGDGDMFNLFNFKGKIVKGIVSLEIEE